MCDNGSASDLCDVGDRNTKKRVAFSDGNPARNLGRNEGDLEILDGDMNTSMVNGIPAIAFSECIKDILFKEMESTVIFKLLGRNIGYNVLYNRLLNLWKPANSFHLMDITNGYFFVKFQDMEDYNKVLTQGPWIIFEQYLIVQPGTRKFNPAQLYPSVVLAWVRLPGLPGYLYKRLIIEAIGGLVGKVVKLYFQTDNSTRGKFAQLAVFVNLDEPLISKVLVDGDIQRVEYKSFPTMILDSMEAPTVKTSDGTVDEGGEGKNNDFGPWMLVEKKSRRGSRDFRANETAKLGKDPLGSRFTPLIERNILGGGLDEAVGGSGSGKDRRHVELGGNLKENRVGRRAEEGSMDVVRPVLGSRVSGMAAAGAGLGNGDSGSKLVGKRPMGFGDFSQKDKDQFCNSTNSTSLVSSTGSINLKLGAAHADGLLDGSISGPSREQARLNVPLNSNGSFFNGLDSSFPNGHNIFLKNQFADNTSSKVVFEQEIEKEHSGLPEFRKENLVLNNPMFEGSNELVVDLDANFLNPKHHSAVIIKDKNLDKAPKGRGSKNKVGNNRGGASFNRSFKDKGGRLKNAKISRIPLSDAISSMVNLVNSQGGPGSDVIGERAERQSGGSESTPA
ncbi:hypothetical protein GOBAR_AA03080 [Gossypium barbadense]|uniref:DUF4283 domain-containing protein n=1 Tax=Gossypium barbadense TaxID=3634 RepID=A0A2P5YPG5_GOSBA|nr:hypothetical protein GOBAR_AA03080 [Gossypium barbadense]